MKNLILCFFMLIASCTLVHADAITFEAAVNSPRISLDEVLQLTLTITGVSDNLDPVSLPVIDGFSAKYVGPSTSVSIVNGDYHSERSFIYNLFPNRIGKFQIPVISATIAGHTYSTQPIDVEVFENTTQSQASASNPAQNQGPTADTLKDKVLIQVSIDKNQVYLNERIPLTIKLLVNDVPIRDIQFPQFDKTVFLVDDYEKPLQDSQIVNGVRYDTVEFKTNIYPSRLGDLPLGPVQIQGNVLYKTSQNNPFGQENDFFGNNIFNNFFDSYANRPVTITSQALQLHVSQLPEENRPGDFSGAIGQFDFQASVAPLKIKAGDPLTLKMDLKGSGNFKNLKIPVFQAPGFKTYDPQIKNLGDEKTAEEVIIPTSAGVKEVPAVSFSFFDPSIKDYKTITQGPFPIQVEAPNPEQEFKAVGFTDIVKEPVAAPVNQFSFGIIVHKIVKFLKKLSSSIWFWVSLAGFLLVVAGYYIWRRFQDRLEHDPAFARRLKAAKEARQALILAKDLIEKGKTKEFYALLTKVVHDYLANKWHKPSAAMDLDEILGHLKAANLDKKQIDDVKTILEQADLVCFAGDSRDAAQMQSDLTLTHSLITYLQQHLK